jgi:hypothetical protein
MSKSARALSTLCLTVSAGMLFLSFSCLCSTGTMVGYYLAGAGAALYPFGFDPRRIGRLLGLALIILNMVLASADNNAGMDRVNKMWRQAMERNLKPPTTRPATR